MSLSIKKTTELSLKKNGFSNTNIINYDCICIGTGITVSLEAWHKASEGLSVLMTDKSKTFGGAWKTIKIDGIEDVENAIHYFLPDDKGIKFMSEDLGLPIKPSIGKFRFFKPLNLIFIKFRYSSLVGRFMHKLFFPKEAAQQHLTKKFSTYGSTLKSFSSVFRHFYLALLLVYRERGERSYHTLTGSAGMLKKVQERLEGSGVEVWYQSEISKIYFDMIDRKVFCQVGDKTVVAKSLVFGHGARLPKLESSNGPLDVEEKFHPRPAYHLVVEDTTTTNVLEAIMTSDSLIKYVQDVTRFSSLRHEKNKKRKVFVFALQHEVEDYDALAEELLEKLKEINAVGKRTRIITSLYSEVILPTLYDEDLYAIKDKFGALVTVLRTENFTAGIGYYAERWSEKSNYAQPPKLT